MIFNAYLLVIEFFSVSHIYVFRFFSNCVFSVFLNNLNEILIYIRDSVLAVFITNILLLAFYLLCSLIHIFKFYKEKSIHFSLCNFFYCSFTLEN